MALTILKQMLLNFNTFNHSNVATNDKKKTNKTFAYSKTKLKNVMFCLLFAIFSKEGTIRQKANARA